MDAERMPGDAEAEAAAAGMREIYGAVSVGDVVNFRREDWPNGHRCGSGRVLEVHAGGLVVEFDGEPLSVAAREILPF